MKMKRRGVEANRTIQPALHTQKPTHIERSDLIRPEAPKRPANAGPKTGDEINKWEKEMNRGRERERHREKKRVIRGSQQPQKGQTQHMDSGAHTRIHKGTL